MTTSKSLTMLLSRIWLHLLKKSLMENFIFLCSAYIPEDVSFKKETAKYQWNLLEMLIVIFWKQTGLRYFRALLLKIPVGSRLELSSTCNLWLHRVFAEMEKYLIPLFSPVHFLLIKFQWYICQTMKHFGNCGVKER